MEFAIGIDIGGTKIAAGIVGGDGEVKHKLKINTSQESKEQILIDLKEVILKLLEWSDLRKLRVSGIGIGSAGQVDVKEGKIISGTSNIKEWNDIPLRDIIHSYTSLPVHVDNDVNVLTIAEKVVGAGRNYEEIVCLALGTGVGGGVMTAGKLLHGHWGGAAELGHFSINMNGALCNCGLRGCLETYASGTWIEKQMKQLLKEEQLLEKYEAKTILNSEAVIEFYHQGDRYAVQVIESMITALAYGIINLIHTFNPEVVIMGGGVMSDGEWIIQRLEQELQTKGLRRLIEKVKIKKAELGNDSGLIGAALQVMI
ncbi:ROK family protein [Alkalihalobacillus sp. 1P02AB]|uniref:ROK family protein n=1 Tax=Alkalihalobacillus sp. 1P02AB TaxID=3132260 RepID=UPI0039A60936